LRTKRYLLNVFSSLVLYTITLLCGLVLPRLIIGAYGSATYGLLTSITQFLGYIAIAQAGVGAVSRAMLYVPLANKDTTLISGIVASTELFFRKVSIVFIGYLAILLIIYPNIINKEFDWFYSASLLLIIAFSTFAEYFFGLSYSLLLVADQSRYILNTFQTVLTVLSFGISFVLIKLDFSVQIVKLLSAIVFCAKPFIIRNYAINKYRLTLSKFVPKVALKQTKDAFGQHIAFYLHSNTDIVLLTLFSTMSEVAVYAVYNLIMSKLKDVISEITSGLESVYGDMLARGEYNNVEETLRKFELLMSFLTTVLFGTAIVMCVPFMRIYMSGISDANYINYDLVVAMTWAEIVYCVRIPYAWIITAAGNFRQTKWAAYCEAGINIVLSLILLRVWGMVGLVVATGVSTLLRGFYFAYYSSKKILNRSYWIFIKHLLALMMCMLIVQSFYYWFLDGKFSQTYISWIECSLLVVLFSSTISIIINYIVFKSDVLDLYSYIETRLMLLKKGEK